MVRTQPEDECAMEIHAPVELVSWIETCHRLEDFQQWLGEERLKKIAQAKPG